LSKLKSIFYSERIERFFLSVDDAKVYDQTHGSAEWANKNSFDALTYGEAAGRKLPLEFTASTLDYFRLWVVCHALTLLTLGIYGPWARTRKAEFLGRHWLLDGQSFQVRFVPMALLRGRAILLGFFLLVYLLTWWNPWLGPAATLATFLAAPWLLANSFAFRWRTLSFRGMRFDSKSSASPLIVPVVGLGVFLALNQLPFSYQFLPNLLRQHLLLGLVVMLLFIFVSICAWSGAVSALTHFRFSQARWGDTNFKLDASPKQFIRHTIRILFSLPVILFLISLIYIIGMVFVAGNRDAVAGAFVMYYLVLIVYSTTFARARRLNFALHRLAIGGLTFKSSIQPIKAGLLTAGYSLLALCTLGLSIPWSTVHLNRWRQQRIQIFLESDWTQFSSLHALNTASGVLDELGNSFDIEVGL
jgi:uncharacterized membrane protein YjgN (DUF898 family)